MTEVGPAAGPGDEAADGTPARRASLGRATALMASGTLVSRLLGFAKNAMLVAAIGVTTYAADAYDVANRIPNALYAILAAGVLNAVLVPQIVRAFARPDGKRTVDRIVTLGLTFSFGITVLFTLAAPIAVALYSQGWSPAQRSLATAFAVWVIPQLFFYAAYTILGEVLNAREQFGPYMWAPALNNIVSMIGLGIYLAVYGLDTDAKEAQLSQVESWSPTDPHIMLLGGTATLGIAAQALILIWPLLRGGYRPSWVWRGPKGELAVVRMIAGWALGAVLVEQVGVIVATRVASSASAAAGPGAENIAGNAAYFNAMLVYLVPHSLITVSIATALMTSMARHAAAEDMPAVRADVSRGLRVIATFTFLAAAVLIVLAPWLLRIVLPSESAASIESVAHVLIAMAVGLVPLGAMVLVKRVYYVLEDARGIFFIHIPMTAAWIAVALLGRELLEPQWWTVSVALGMSLSNVVGFSLRIGGLRRRLGGIDGRRVASVHLRALAASLAAGGAGWLVLQALPRIDEVSGSTWTVVAIAVGVCAGVGIVVTAVYVAAMLAMRVTEMRDLTDTLTRRFRRTVR